MFNNSKRFLIYSGLFLVLLTLSSCIFFRMLDVRDQLNDFETNFDLNDDRGLTLVFKNPVLMSDDVIWLMKGSPVSVKPEQEGQLWTYVFQKQYLTSQEEGDEYDIPILMVMEDDKLTEVTFPERFLNNLSIPLLKKMLASMGNADISKLRKSASSTYTGEDPTEIPTSDNVQETLGIPYEIEDLGENSKLSYLYYLEDAQGNATKDNLNFELWFIAGNDDKALKRVGGKIRGIKLSLDFEAPENDI
ncbi:MAG: hypothetical protein WBA70_10140 [Thermodesulfobacteriota bacterium]